MITFSRQVARQFRAALRRSVLLGCSKRFQPAVVFSATADQLTLHSRKDDLVVAYQLAGQFTPNTVVLPLAALEACEGSNTTSVIVTPKPRQHVEVAWYERGVPRAEMYEALPADKAPPLPALPVKWQMTDAKLLTALDFA